MKSVQVRTSGEGGGVSETGDFTAYVLMPPKLITLCPKYEEL